MDTRPPIFAIRFSLTVLMALGWLRAAEPPGSLKALLAEALSNNPEILASQKRYEASGSGRAR